MLNKLYFFFVLILGFIIFLPIFGIFNKIEFNSLYLFEFIQSKYNLRLIYITFLQAFLSSLISCVLALPFAISLFRRKKKLINRILISLSGYSFVLPSILIVYSVIGLFGTNGALNKITNLYDVFNIRTIFGLQGILIAHVLLNTPFAVRIFVQNLNSIPKKYIEVAKSMNFSFWQNYLYLEWPIIRQNFFSIFSIIFILCFLSFAIVMSMFPDSTRVTKDTMNYTVAVNAGVWILSLTYYFVWGHRAYSGPKSNLDDSDSEISSVKNLDELLNEKK